MSFTCSDTSHRMSACQRRAVSRHRRGFLRPRAHGRFLRLRDGALLLQLARKHGLQVPGMALPGPRELWNPYRVTPTAKAESLPEVPVHTLLEFARTDLNTEEQAILPTLWFSDPASRMKVNEMYLERNPKVLQQLRKADQQAQQRKQKK